LPHGAVLRKKEQLKVFGEINSLFNTLKESPDLVGGIGYNDVLAALKPKD
jgi:hypothetical protein